MNIMDCKDLRKDKRTRKTRPSSGGKNTHMKTNNYDKWASRSHHYKQDKARNWRKISDRSSHHSARQERREDLLRGDIALSDLPLKHPHTTSWRDKRGRENQRAQQRERNRWIATHHEPIHDGRYACYTCETYSTDRWCFECRRSMTCEIEPQYRCSICYESSSDRQFGCECLR